MQQSFFFNIDVVGSCNLHCPTCPQGNTEVELPRAVMSKETLRSILSRATSECRVNGVGLFNWTEPLIHPRLAELVKVVRSEYDLPCHLSSNLNHIVNLEQVIASEPTSFRVSLSGYRQVNYEQTHASGDVEKVKANMVILSESVQRHDNKTKVHVLWHRYKNRDEDEALMREFATGLGFAFVPVEAYMMPLERVLDRWSGGNGYLPVEALLKTRIEDCQPRCAKHKSMPCRLQNREITIDSSGRVHTCCAMFDPALTSLGVSFVETGVETIQAMKASHSTCDRCLKAGGHVYATYGWKPLERWKQRAANLYRYVR